MKRMIILHSYNLTGRNPYDFVRIKYFFKELKEQGYEEGKNLHAEVIDSNDLCELESALKEEGKDGIDLIHAVGTPNAAVASSYSREIPIVYYGAHPEDSGKEECSYQNMCGLILTLPFTSNYKDFRFTKKLLPATQSIYVPYYEKTIFCTETMKERYRILKSQSNDPTWTPMDSEYIAYRSLAGLCYIIGINYFEYVYSNIEELSAVLALTEPKDSLIMPYNDSVYCHGAPKLLCESSIKRSIPLLWNNNPEATRIGALAAIAGCFKEAGSVTGKMAGKILNGAQPSSLGFQISTKSYSSICLKTAKRFDLEFPEDVLDYFDEIIS